MNGTQVEELIQDLTKIFDEAHVPPFEQIGNPVVRVAERAKFLAAYYSTNAGQMKRALERLDQLRDLLKGNNNDNPVS